MKRATKPHPDDLITTEPTDLLVRPAILHRGTRHDGSESADRRRRLVEVHTRYLVDDPPVARSLSSFRRRGVVISG